jgi:hypothetical protein
VGCNLRLLLSVVALVIASHCYAAANPLIGSWKWDNEKTLQQFKIPSKGSHQLMESAAKAKRFVIATRTRLRSHMVLIYRDEECAEVIYDKSGHELSRKWSPYRVVTIAKDYVVIDENGGIAKIYLDDDNSFHVLVRIGDFVYKDYFTRISK